MGCRNSRERVIEEIIGRSEHRLTEQDIEEIMMNTQCKPMLVTDPFTVNEHELLKIFKKFQELDVTGRNMLTNKEFLELPELKYTPFRSRLVEGFQLKSDSDVKSMHIMR